ncbi:hypothetical protein ABH09_10685 [Treponema sp. OMZ 803]|uniref:hypothetical protein n=1 Tax=Treponema sp. OMZ 803 TaxID=120682 RepID=UPI0020A26155|nr:hypothetical protein [Treponema sp. OMZ 803]UTC52788.1 hypothetical protein ABH09_10685 [Treponema sp. OMZ 803]
MTRAKFPAQFSTQHSALSTQHSALSTQHSALSTQHSALSTQHSALSTQHSALSTQHSALSTQHSALSTQHNVAFDDFLTQKQIDLPLYSAPLPSTLKKYTSAKNNSIYRHSFTVFSIGARLQCRHFSTLSLFAHSILKGLVGRISRTPHNEEWGCQKTNQFLRHPYRPYIKLSKSGEFYES